MAGLREGSFVAVKYAVSGPPIDHERMILSGTSHPNWYIILTPDFDSFGEECAMMNEDLDDLVVLRGRGEQPPVMAEATFYQFQAPPTRDPRYSARLRTAQALGRSFVPPGTSEKGRSSCRRTSCRGR